MPPALDHVSHACSFLAPNMRHHTERKSKGLCACQHTSTTISKRTSSQVNKLLLYSHTVMTQHCKSHAARSLNNLRYQCCSQFFAQINTNASLKTIRKLSVAHNCTRQAQRRTSRAQQEQTHTQDYVTTKPWYALNIRTEDLRS